MLWLKGRRYKLWWSGKGDGIGGVGVMVKEELCEEVVQVRRVRVMTLVVVFAEVDLWVCSTKWKKFDDKLKCDWNMHSADDLAMCLGDIKGHAGRHIDGFDGVHGGYGVRQRNFEGRMLLESCLEKELCVSNTCFKREEKRKVTFKICENETEIDFVLTKNTDGLLKM